MTSIIDKRLAWLALLLLVVCTPQLGVNGQVGVQKVPAPSSPREAELEEARQLTLEVVKLINQGEYDEAMPRAARVLEIRERALGPVHPDVAYALSNVAYILYKKNDYKKARELYERARGMLCSHWSLMRGTMI